MHLDAIPGQDWLARKCAAGIVVNNGVSSRKLDPEAFTADQVPSVPLGTGGQCISRVTHGRNALSKDARPDLHQMVLGVVIDEPGAKDFWPAHKRSIEKQIVKLGVKVGSGDATGCNQGWSATYRPQTNQTEATRHSGSTARTGGQHSRDCMGTASKPRRRGMRSPIWVARCWRRHSTPSAIPSIAALGRLRVRVAKAVSAPSA